MADSSALRAYLPKAGGTEVACIDADDRGAFRAAVALERANAEAILECQSHAFRELFRAHDDVLQAAEIVGLAAAHVGLQKRWSGQEKGHSVAAHQRSNRAEVQRVRMIDDANAKRGGKPESHGEAPAMQQEDESDQASLPIEQGRLSAREQLPTH